MVFSRPGKDEILRTLGGVCLILIALKLPGIFMDSRGTWGPSGVVSGWRCAMQANSMLRLLPQVLSHPSPGSGGLLLLIMTGFINPLLVLSFIPLRLWQFWCAVAILVCLIATWAAMAISSFTPQIGHFLWVAGILLILSRELHEDPFASYWQSKSASD